MDKEKLLKHLKLEITAAAERKIELITLSLEDAKTAVALLEGEDECELDG